MPVEAPPANADEYIKSLQEQIGLQNLEAQILRTRIVDGGANAEQAEEQVEKQGQKVLIQDASAPFGATLEAHITTLRDAYEMKEQEQTVNFLKLTEERAELERQLISVRHHLGLVQRQGAADLRKSKEQVSKWQNKAQMAVEQSITSEKKMEQSERSLARAAQVHADAQETWERERKLAIIEREQQNAVIDRLTNGNREQHEQVEKLNKRWAAGEKTLASAQTQLEKVQSAGETCQDALEQKETAILELQDELKQMQLVAAQDAESLKKCRQDCRELATENVQLENTQAQTRAERTQAIQRAEKLQSAIARCRGEYAELNAKQQQSQATIDTVQADFREAQRLATKHAAANGQLRDVKMAALERQIKVMQSDANASVALMNEVEEQNTKLKGLVAIQQEQVGITVSVSYWAHSLPCGCTTDNLLLGVCLYVCARAVPSALPSAVPSSLAVCV
jgi:hypothetical protein